MFFSKDKIISRDYLPEEVDFRSGKLFLVDKPLEWTSFDVVNKIRFALRHHLKEKNIKVGHAGTLDPLATGLLLVCCGKATKQIDKLANMDKCYSGTMYLGATTPSYDKESQPDQTFDISNIRDGMIINQIGLFTGEQSQVPPLFSAIRVNGKKGYELARRGVEAKMESRTVFIHDFRITSIRLPEIDFFVCCSKGTYIRSLVHDFGKSLNAGAYLHSLRRESIAGFSVNDALRVDEVVNYIQSTKVINPSPS